MDANLNPYEAAADSVHQRRFPNSPAQLTAATTAIKRLVPDPDTALIAAAALGLTDPLQPLPGIPDTGSSAVRHPGAATHGSRAGVAWHREQRKPLCGPCRKWLGTHGTAAKEGD